MGVVGVEVREMVREKGEGEDWGWLGGMGGGREEGWLWEQGSLYLN